MEPFWYNLVETRLMKTLIFFRELSGFSDHKTENTRFKVKSLNSTKRVAFIASPNKSYRMIFTLSVNRY